MKNSIIYLMILVLMLSSCRMKNKEIVLEEISIETDNVSSISNEMKTVIVQYFEDLEYEGDIEGSIKYELIKFDSKTNIGKDIVLVRAVLEYAWVDMLLVFQDDNIIFSMSGMSPTSLYLTDLNGDGIKEMLYQSTIGSGILRHTLLLCDFNDGSMYNYTFYNNNNDAVLAKEEDGVYVYSYYQFGKESEEPLGRLEYNGEELFIEGYVTEFGFVN